MNTIWAILVVVVTLIAAFPRLATKIFGNIWSWEGFFLSANSFDSKAWICFFAGLVLFLIVVLLIAFLPDLVWKRMLKENICLWTSLVLGNKHCRLFFLKPTADKLELVLGKRVKVCCWRRMGRVRWMLVCFAGVLSIAVFPKEIPLTSRWFEQYNLVAHAGGISPNGNTYSNSLEAFETNYQQGHRVFEGDLCLTSDGILVLEHDWEHWHYKVGIEYAGQDVTYERFMQTKFYGTETPMDITMLIDLMVRYQDMYFMTDFKNDYNENDVKSGFRQIVQAAEMANCEDILKRFIIQNHNNQFKHWVDSVYPFENWLYTCYSVPIEEDRSPENMTAYCEQENIPVITMWYYMPDDTWFSCAKQHNLKIFVHTINDVDYAKAQLSSGVSGIYTDTIKPPLDSRY